MKLRYLPPPEKWNILGIPALFFIGSLFHFLYDLTGKSAFAGSFTAVNESVWEHTKMVLLPIIYWWTLYFIIKGKKHKIEKRSWFTGLTVSLSTAILSIPFAFYFYTGAFGIELLAVDIFILLLADTAGQFLGNHFYRYYKGLPLYASIIIVTVIFTAYIIFTFYAPHLPMFRDGSTGMYGI